MNKKAIEMGFNVMFAIIAGIAILGLAIYGTSRFIDTGSKAVSTATSAKIISLLDPLETGLASGNSEQINFKKESRMFFECYEDENYPFGRQTISFSEQTIGEKFGERGGDVPIYNKYVFSRNMVQGKQFNIFSKEFLMPFKVADLIIINSEKYCFHSATNEIKKDVENLNIQNIQFSDDLQNCTGINVCFGVDSSECDMVVDGCLNEGCESGYEYGRVSKGIDDLYYTDSLLYAAIFSSQENYECNLKRLMSKFNELSLIYIDKIKIIQRKGCRGDIEVGLRNLMNKANSLEGSKGIKDLAIIAEDIDKANQATTSACRVY